MRVVSPEPSLLAHTSSESRGTFRQKARFLAPLNGWACAVKICHDGMLEDTNSLDGAHMTWLRGSCRSITWVTVMYCDTNYISAPKMICMLRLTKSNAALWQYCVGTIIMYI